ncbi:MAG TPA: acyl-CoA dehydrogenase family protein [Acidimicrobiales bacterium]|jgi:hypothetical protein|nr:acyl-CoA dehydrogenase family protein [Acidimicrobiales bacterium]
MAIDFTLAPEHEEIRSRVRSFIQDTVPPRSMQLHGALGYSTDTPLANMLQHARWARFPDGADEIHQMRIAERTIAAYKDSGSTNAATGGLPL